MSKKLNLFINNKKNIFFIVISVFIIITIVATMAEIANTAKHNPYLLYFIIPVFILFIATMIFTYKYLFSESFEIHKWFLVTSILLSSAFLIIIPPLNAPDENLHYCTANQLTTNMMSNFSGITTDLTKNVPCEDNDYLLYNYGHSSSKTFETISNSLLKINEQNKDTIIESMPYQTVLSYIPQSIGIVVGNVFGFDNLMKLYLGSFLSIIFYCVILSVSIKIIPFGKELLAMIGLFPLSLELASSFSYDSTVIALGVFIIAYFLYLAFDNAKARINIYDVLILAFSSIIFQPIKQIYIFIALLCFAIPKTKFKSKTSRIITLSIVFLSTLLPVLPNLLSVFGSVLGFSESSGNGLSDMNTYTVSYYLSNPIFTMQLGIRSVIYWCIAFLPTALGRTLGLLNIPMPLPLVIISSLLVLSSIMLKNDDYPELSKKSKTYFGIICILITVYMFGYWAIRWTLVGDQMIMGIQGRYFTPFMFLILYLFHNKKYVISKKYSPYLLTAYTSLQLVYLVISFITIINR